MLTTGRTTKCFCDIRHIWDDSFDAIAFSLNLGQQHRHAAGNVSAGRLEIGRELLTGNGKTCPTSGKVMASTKCFKGRRQENALKIWKRDATVQAASQTANEAGDIIILTSTSRRILTVAPDAMMSYS
jgi:hypothetical protein